MAELNPFKGRVIIITGAAQGIGGAVARYVAARGAIVSLSDISEETVQATAQRIRDEYPESEALGHRIDVCDEEAVQKWVEGVKKQFGRIDGCVNSAARIFGCGQERIGIFPPEMVPITNVKLADWRRVIDVNLTGVFICLQHELRAIEDGGSIVNVSSGAGLAALGDTGAYIASKHGVVGITKAAAVESASRRVRVNAVCPHLVATPMAETVFALSGGGLHGAAGTLLSGPIDADEVAALISFLLSDDARHVTKSTYQIDCGWLAA